MINTSLQSHAGNNQENLKASLIQQNIKNIKRFLSAFKESNNFSLLSTEFTKDNYVFMKQSQAPDCWLKTRISFNRNLIFHQNSFLDKNQSVYKRKYKRASGNVKKLWVMAPNYYPQVPFSLTEECSLVSKPNPKKNNEQKEVEMVFSGLTKKSWVVSYFHQNEAISYGPMNSLKVYYFLKNFYNQMKDEDKDKKSIMIVDTKYDVHYQPETLFQFLDEEYCRSNKGEEGVLNEVKEINSAYFEGKSEDGINSKEDSNKRDSNSDSATATTTYSTLNNKEDEIEIAGVN